MSQAEIGLIGLGVMGSNLALNIAEKGNRIAVFNRTTATDRCLHGLGRKTWQPISFRQKPWKTSLPASARRAR